jgi:hypothetical protein
VPESSAAEYIEYVLLSLIASIGFALGKKKTLSAVGHPAVT